MPTPARPVLLGASLFFGVGAGCIFFSSDYPCDGDANCPSDMRCVEATCRAVGEPVDAGKLPGEGEGEGEDGGPDPVDGGADAGPPPDFPYPPSNFEPADVPRPSAGLLVDCDATLETSPPAFTGCGGNEPVLEVIALPGDAEALVVASLGLIVTEGATLTVVGERPVIFASFGDVLIDGTVSASADGRSPGAGADHPSVCSGGRGEDGDDDGDGGGGGGFGGAGARGGSSGAGLGGSGGSADGAASLVPLRGGCSGGAGASTDRPGGLGGGGAGALQISALGHLVVRGVVAAAGGGGGGGRSRSGGGGGGSGGALLLEGNTVALQGGRALAGGGGGGAGGTGGNQERPAGEDGSSEGATPAAGGVSGTGEGGSGAAGGVPAEAGTDDSGAGGGGGGEGLLRLNAATSCSVDGDALLSARVSSNGADGCP